MHEEYFVFDGKSSSSMGVVLQRPIVFPLPKRKVETISVPGRSGDLHISQDAFENTQVEVDCYSLTRNLISVERNIFEWLLASTGYKKLEYSTEPHFYRLARCVGVNEYDNKNSLLGVFSVEFDLCPMRYYKSGQFYYPVRSGQTLFSPSQYKSRPLIKVSASGSGNLYIAGQQYKILDLNGVMVFDCETENATINDIDANEHIKSPESPTLGKENYIAWDGDIGSVEIMPRWVTV